MSEKLNRFLCGTDSRIGDFAEKLAGEAVTCWCCSFFRGLFIGGVVGTLVGAILL